MICARTVRLTLRPLRLTDTEDLYAFMGDFSIALWHAESVARVVVVVRIALQRLSIDYLASLTSAQLDVSLT